MEGKPQKGTRTGFTTGACSAAAARACAVGMVHGLVPPHITSLLPNGDRVSFAVGEGMVEGEGVERHARAWIEKFAGDDPDCTDKAHLTVDLRVLPGQVGRIVYRNGEGVGTVTMPGLGLEVGGPAINPVPRQQIRANVADAVREAKPEEPNYLAEHGLEVIISVPAGAELAQKTLNSRLGIIGGISILGTTGKVFPYSTAAWRASVIQAVEVAAKNSVEKVVLATGGRSEKFAMRLFPQLPAVAFVELSVFTGDAFKTCIAHGVRSAAFVGMIGKMVKTAQGHMTTHVAGNQVDFEFLAQVCRQSGAPEAFTQAVAAANTGRHFLELCQEHNFTAPLQHVVDLALTACERYVQDQRGALELEVVLIDFDGTVLGRAKGGQAASTQAVDAIPLIQRLSADPAHSYDEESVMGGQGSRGVEEQG